MALMPFSIFWQFDKVISKFWAYFYWICTEPTICELPVKNLTQPFATVTLISYKTDIYFHYEMTFLENIRCFCATISYDLDSKGHAQVGSRSPFHLQLSTQQFLPSYTYRFLS